MTEYDYDREADRHREEPEEREAEERLADRVGELAQALLGNPVVNQALGTAYGARDKALGAQRLAMGALDLPSASDLERLERRLRSMGERIDALEAEVDRLSADVRHLREGQAGPNV